MGRRHGVRRDANDSTGADTVRQRHESVPALVQRHARRGAARESVAREDGAAVRARRGLDP